VAHEAIRRTYSDLLGDEDEKRRPNGLEQERAKTLLEGYNVRAWLFS